MFPDGKWIIQTENGPKKLLVTLGWADEETGKKGFMYVNTEQFDQCRGWDGHMETLELMAMKALGKTE